MAGTITVNKIGGENMSRLDQVLNLANVLRENGECPVFVVSAFRGVTNKLIVALDQLNDTDYTEESIRAAFGDALAIVNGKIDEFVKTGELNNQAKEHVKREMDICITALLTHKSVTKILSPGDTTHKVRDKIIAFGERSAVGVLEAYLQENNIPAKAVNDVKYSGNGESDGGRISKRELHRGIQRGIAKAVDPFKDQIGEKIFVIGGHVSNVLRGMVPEIGRSYTDTTAVDATLAFDGILRKSVGTTVFWKAVDGVLSADPKQLDARVNKPIVHTDVSLNEALEIAASGSQIMQIDALGLALREGCPLVLKNIEKPREDGTTFSVGESISEFPFKVVMFNKDVDIVYCKIPEMAMGVGFVSKLAQQFGDNDISINDILTAGTSISFTINLPPDAANKHELRRRIRQVIASLHNIEIENEVYECNPQWDKSKANVVIIGDELRGAAGILSVISGVFAAERINVEGIMHDVEQRKISFYVSRRNAERAVQVLHRMFIDKDKEYAARNSKKMEEGVQSFLT